MSVSNFGKIGQSVAKIVNIFQFFKIAADAILDFQICEISLAETVWKAQTHHRAKYGQNWSSVVETLQFFEFSK